MITVEKYGPARYAVLGYENESQLDMYVDNINGSDSNSGTISRPFKTLVKAESMIPDIQSQPVIIHINPYDAAIPNAGSYVCPVFRLRSRRHPIIIRGEGEETIASNVALAGTDQVHISTGGLIPDEYVTASASVVMTSGLAAGDRRSISENTAFDIIPSAAFSDVCAVGDAYKIVKPLVRLALQAQPQGGTILYEGTGGTGFINNVPATGGLFFVNLKIEGAVANDVVNCRNAPAWFYGVNLVNIARIVANAGVLSGAETERNVSPYQTNHTLTTYCPDLSPNLTSATGWGLIFESQNASLECDSPGYQGYIVAMVSIAVRAGGQRELTKSVAELRGGRTGILLVGTLQRYDSGRVLILTAKSAADPHIDFKLRPTFAYSCITIRNASVELGHVDLGTNSPVDGIVVQGPNAKCFVYQTYGSVLGIGLRAKHVGTIQCQNLPAISGVIGDFSEDDGVTLRAMATLLNGTYFRDPVAGGLVFRED